MAKKSIKIWVAEETISALKRGAGYAGKSLSEFAATVLDISLQRKPELDWSTSFESGGGNIS